MLRSQKSSKPLITVGLGVVVAALRLVDQVGLEHAGTHGSASGCPLSCRGKRGGALAERAFESNWCRMAKRIRPARPACSARVPLASGGGRYDRT
jgi:hypothetical protein